MLKITVLSRFGSAENVAKNLNICQKVDSITALMNAALLLIGERKRQVRKRLGSS